MKYIYLYENYQMTYSIIKYEIIMDCTLLFMLL